MNKVDAIREIEDTICDHYYGCEECADDCNLRLAKKALEAYTGEGKWIEEPFETGGETITVFRCDKCNETQIMPSHYCPNCGADMR